MADDDDIHELIKRMAGAQRQGFHLTPGAMRVVVTALRFYLAARSWLAKSPLDPHDDKPRTTPEKHTGPPATIAELRRHGLVAVSITCDAPNCWNTKRVTLDALRLDETTAVPEIPQRRNFRCQKCGCRRVRVTPDWTDHKAQGNGRAVQ